MRTTFLLLLLSSCAPARQVGLAAVSTALLAADWHQTRSDIVPACAELNPVIGPCGERFHPDAYFPLVMATNLALGLLLPRPWGELTWATVAGVQGATVWNNAQ